MHTQTQTCRHRHTKTPAHTPKDIHTNTHRSTERHTHAHTCTHADTTISSPLPPEGSKALHLQSCSSLVHRWKVIWGLGRGMLGSRSWRGSPEGQAVETTEERTVGFSSALSPPPAPVWGLWGWVAETLALLYLALSSSSASLPPPAHPGPNTCPRMPSGSQFPTNFLAGPSRPFTSQLTASFPTFSPSPSPAAAMLPFRLFRDILATCRPGERPPYFSGPPPGACTQ